MMQIKKIFILGNSRSGTKLAQCLKLNSQIHTLRKIFSIKWCQAFEIILKKEQVIKENFSNSKHTY